MPPSTMLIKALSRVHTFWYAATGGRIGGRVSGAPVLLLTTQGRRSGKRHTTPLLYVEEGANLVVVASNGGRDWHPSWWLNLRANPAAQVQIGDQRKGVRAQEATGEERERLWQRLVQMYPGYEEYRKSTQRKIPVVILQPE